MSARLPLQALKDGLLFELFRLSEVSLEMLSIEEIGRLFKDVSAPLKQIEVAADQLADKRLLDYILVINSGRRYKISNEGYEYVLSQLDDSASIFYRLEQQGQKALLDPAPVAITPTTYGDGDSMNLAGFVSIPPSPPPASAVINATGNRNFANEGLVGGAPLNEHPFNGPDIVPAADRYVSVKDNRPGFDELVTRLSAIKDEYARDHNHLAAEPAAIEMLSEIDAVLAQIQRGVVRLGQIAYGLLPSFDKVCLALAAYPGFAELVHDAIPAAKAILTSFGFE